jgi:biopolymer transport protein ExbD
MPKPFVEQAPTVARINVTPIIDVALVLVIVLLITAPMIAVSDMQIQLPAAKTRSVESDARVNITLGLDGAIAVDDKDVSRSQMFAILADRIDTEGTRLLVVVRADEGVSYQSVEELLKDARGAGARRLAIATRQPGGKR